MPYREFTPYELLLAADKCHEGERVEPCPGRLL